MNPFSGAAAATWKSAPERAPKGSIQVINRKGTPATSYDPTHKRMQAELLKILRERFGHDSVKYEEGYVDLKVSNSSRTILIEVKTDACAREAIRAALGQILEYAYFNPSGKGKEPELVIIAPAPQTAEVRGYFDLLQSKFALNLRYLQFTVGGTLGKL